jgi:hypothetical protein
VIKGSKAFTRKLHARGPASRLTIENKANRIVVVRAMAYTACTLRLQASVDEAVMGTSLIQYGAHEVVLHVPSGRSSISTRRSKAL